MENICKSITAAACLALLAEPAGAQEPPANGLMIELNATEQAETACKLSFLILNGHDADVSSAVFEAVLFDRDERIDRLTLFDFGELPSGRPRVRQFVLPGLDCAALGRVLINGAETCESGIEGKAVCSEGIELRSRSDVELVG